MLIVDHGLGHLAKKHDVAYDFQDWHRVLEELMRRKETLPRSQEKDQLSNILHHLYIIKDAYRVPTMHARGIYTEDKARVIYDNAAAFMETLAVFV